MDPRSFDHWSQLPPGNNGPLSRLRSRLDKFAFVRWMARWGWKGAVVMVAVAVVAIPLLLATATVIDVFVLRLDERQANRERDIMWVEPMNGTEIVRETGPFDFGEPFSFGDSPARHGVEYFIEATPEEVIAHYESACVALGGVVLAAEGATRADDVLCSYGRAASRLDVQAEEEYSSYTRELRGPLPDGHVHVDFQVESPNWSGGVPVDVRVDR